MGNTQGVWVLCRIVLALNFLIDEKQRAAAKRPGIEKGTVEMNQCTYFRKALTLKKLKDVFVKWKSKMLWRSSFAFVSTGNKRLWIHSRLICTWFDQGRPPETL